MTGLEKLVAAATALSLLAGSQFAAAQTIEVGQISPLPPRKPAAGVESGPQFKPAPGVGAAASAESAEESAAASDQQDTAAAETGEPASPATIEIAPLDRLQPLAPNDAASSPTGVEDAVDGNQLATAPPDEAAESGESEGRFLRAPFSAPDPMRVERPIAPLPTTSGERAVVRELDKFSGITKDVEIAVGSEATVDRLRIRLDGCEAPAANSSQGTMAFLRIWDTKNESIDPVFHGWMFAESPALSAMDHPRYDVWLISCSASEGEASTASE